MKIKGQQPSATTQRRVNLWSARVIPLVLAGAVGYATWVIVVLLCTNYLLHPPRHVPQRTAAGISILVIYSLLLLGMASAYLRTLHVITINPGVVPLPTTPTIQKEVVDSAEFLDRGSVSGGRASAPGGLESFYNRDRFECEVDGLPRWCSTCRNWKPDRAHHCSEIGRCVYKMDHYCPWVGGIVSETAFKFFIQFCAYAACYCTFSGIIMAYFLVQRHRELGTYDANWSVAIGLSSLFGLFSSGMTSSSLFFSLTNLSTVENLARRSRTYNFAVLLPPSSASSQISSPAHYQTITYPLLPSPSPQSSDPGTEGEADGADHPYPSRPQRTFAIIHVPKGQNPYSLSPWRNFKEVLGKKPWDWMLPIRYSPCCEHGIEDIGSRRGARDVEKGGEVREIGGSMYPMGEVLERLKKEAGIGAAGNEVAGKGPEEEARGIRGGGVVL